MSRELLTRVVVLGAIASTLAAGRAAYGVDPNALQSAYWRFEEGVAGGYVDANGPEVVDSNGNQITLNDTVHDSINNNFMKAFNTETAPKYVAQNLPPTNLKSGLSNTLAWEVNGTSTGGQDVYTSDNEQIQNGIVGGKYLTDHDDNDETAKILVDSTTTGFTLEAAFSVFDTSSFRSIIAKEGRPGLEQAQEGGQVGDDNFQALPTMALKVRGAQFEGDPNQGKLQIELFDAAGNLKSVTTEDAMVLGAWYYAAVVNDGETMSLYLDRNNGEGYELVGTESVDGALFQGMNPDNADWNHNWTIGRATYGGVVPNPDYHPVNNPGVPEFIPNEGGQPSDWFNGLIDEVRLTNEALDPSEFLFAQEAADGDFNEDGSVDGADFLMWQRGQSTNGLTAGDLQDWRDTFGSATVAGAPVPEPGALAIAGLAIIGGLAVRRQRR